MIEELERIMNDCLQRVIQAKENKRPESEIRYAEGLYHATAGALTIAKRRQG